MATKEHQWRLLNALALHEMSSRETAACEQLDQLSERVATLGDTTASLEAMVEACRRKRQNQRFNNVAAPKIRDVCHALGKVEQGYGDACRALVEDGKALHVRGVVVGRQGELAGELERFRAVARRFKDSAGKAGVPELVDVCDALDELAELVGKEEAAAVGCAAEAVLECAGETEKERCARVRDVGERRKGDVFDPLPSFVD